MHPVFRYMVLMFVMPFLWAAANSIDVTQTINKYAGTNIPSGFEIPGMRQALNIKSDVQAEIDAQKAAAAKKVRQAAIKELRQQVRKKYGKEAAALIPNDLTLDEIKNYDFKQFEEIIKEKLPEQKPKPKGPGKKNSGDKYEKATKRLNSLPVKGRAPKTGYSRSQFGSEWSDSSGNFHWTGNKCDTRNDVLKRDLTNVKFDGSCKVVSGTLKHEKYTGKRDVKFIAGGPYENNLDIEHLVALGNAWETGAQQLSAAQRAALANDPINLLAVDPSSNRQKGDADFATWLPKNKAFRCDYAVKQIKVKKKYSLWVTKAEKSAMQNVLKSC